MGSDRNRQKLYLHLAGIVFNILLLAWILASLSAPALAVIGAALLVIQIVALVRYLDRTDRAVAHFLNSVRYADFGQKFDKPDAPDAFREMTGAMEAFIGNMNEARRKTAQNEQYLQVLLRHIPVAVMTVNEDGTVSHFNNAARRLLRINYLSHVNALREIDQGLAEAVRNIPPGEERLVRVASDELSLHLSVGATALNLGARSEKIVSIQDIRESLESRESQAWQNLIRVLNHEIMNSMTPITSLASTGREVVNRLSDTLDLSKGDAAAELRDLELALDAMGQRSAGLMRFVDSYRSLTRLPEPQLEPILLGQFLERINALISPEMLDRGIHWSISVHPPGLELTCDSALLEQAAINLLNNAMDAVVQSAEPAISMSAQPGARGSVRITVQDNGCGMDESVLEQIFVPFFTTKRDGTGVGMNLVRHIVQSQGGQVHVRSTEGKGSAVQLSF